MPTFSPFASPDPIIEAALRNDARLGRPPRYATASVTPIQAPAETDQSRLEARIGQMNAATRALTDALIDQSDVIERLARRNLRGVDLRTINSVNSRVAQAGVQLARIQEILLDADTKQDMTLIDDAGDVMRGALHRLTATDLSARTDLEEHGLTAADLVARRA